MGTNLLNSPIMGLLPRTVGAVGKAAGNIIGRKIQPLREGWSKSAAKRQE
jgi:hypothetical protein